MTRKKLQMARRVAPLVVLLMWSVGAIALALAGYRQHPPGFSTWVDADGNIHLPAGVRESWTHLGTWFVEGTEGELTFHEVYTEPESLAYFREHREFPDGATLVKEIRGLESGAMTTGRASWATEPRLWFVMIKDRRGRFEDHPLWGEGWGWALFDAKDTSAPVTSHYEEDCIACHLPAREDDWVYVGGYPALGVDPTGDEPEDVEPGETEERVVGIRDLAFLRETIRIRVGESVTWVNHDYVPHTATADDGSFETGIIGPGESAEITFDRPGTFSYYCAPHPFMRASVVVEE